jgi:hypothetical protein
LTISLFATFQFPGNRKWRTQISVFLTTADMTRERFLAGEMRGNHDNMAGMGRDVHHGTHLFSRDEIPQSVCLAHNPYIVSSLLHKIEARQIDGPPRQERGSH